MKFFGIIPARYASTRFPGKPLVDIGGKSMIQRVYEQASQLALLSEVVVATDDDRIFKQVEDFGGKVVMTATSHASGTDRCFEAAQKMGVSARDVVINIQGDEPFIAPEQIALLCSCFEEESVNIATLVKAIRLQSELENTSTPKVILAKNRDAIYFSRSIIPHQRGKELNDWLNAGTYYKHIGIYGYRMQTLSELKALPQSTLELAESLEQLRWIENGYRIRTAITDIESTAIDTPEDLKKLTGF
ncbi:MAG: 3-deoxy-manno-octulosonate cytidylyltransferase [Bacteroidetes bacterium]|nr:3-deoxy-manno-octulosonate cytidylyltransferase [Bacteroidota bacterium]